MGRVTYIIPKEYAFNYELPELYVNAKLVFLLV
jgi:hypothetical protein